MAFHIKDYSFDEDNGWFRVLVKDVGMLILRYEDVMSYSPNCNDHLKAINNYINDHFEYNDELKFKKN